MDSNEAAKIGDLEKSSEGVKVARPQFNKDKFPECDHPRWCK